MRLTPEPPSVFDFSESNITDLIFKEQYHFCTNYKVLIPNCYTSHDNECDVFAIRKSGYCDEFEIKVSRSDFFNDSKKKVCVRDYDYKDDSERKWMQSNHHDYLNGKVLAPWQRLKHEALSSGLMAPNYFWYVVKEGVADVSDCPDFAGFVTVDFKGGLKIIKQPRRLHTNKIGQEKELRMVMKLTYRYWDYRLCK